MIKNAPSLWRDVFPVKAGTEHKYDYGHALIYGAPKLTGASRLAAGACARIGAGLVTVLCDGASYDVYRKTLPAHLMVRKDLAFDDPRVTARLYGCGGMIEGLAINTSVPVVLDADVLVPGLPLEHNGLIVTPHEGEFARAFPDIAALDMSREEKALTAARQLGAVVVLKGAQTLIAAPEGRVAMNEAASPYLATAGAGDVLAGIITGLMAMKMPLFEAACAGVWVHGMASLNIGPGLVASDLEKEISKVLQIMLGF